jgi:ATP-dependent RNA helicase DDX3X
MYGDNNGQNPPQGSQPAQQQYQSYRNGPSNDYRIPNNANTSTKSSQSYSSSRMSNEEAAARKAVADTQFFWQQVTRFANQKSYGGGYGRSNNGTKQMNKSYEETQLFGPQNHQAPTELVQGVIDSSIPVERSGPRADEIPVLEAFSELENLPPFIKRNIQLMKYEKPTPIQKHSVPLGLAGLDLMCCAQTVSA